MSNKIFKIIRGEYSIKEIYHKIGYKLFIKSKRRMPNEIKINIERWRTYEYLKKKYWNEFIKDEIYVSSYKYSNKVWWCWLQGEENAPELCKACLESLRKNLKDREIIVITENNLWDYVDFPDFIKEKYEKGIITRTHFSDLLRLELLTRHGGTWIDSSVYCTGDGKEIFDVPLFMYENWKRGDVSVVTSSWLISSEIGNPILCATRDLLYKYWREYDFMLHYFIFHIFFKIATEKYEQDWDEVYRFSNLPPHVLQFELFEKYSEKRKKQIERMSDFHKLSQKIPVPDDIEDSFYKHILNY